MPPFTSLLRKIALQSKHPSSYHAVIILKHGKPSAIATNGDGKHAEQVAIKKVRGGSAGSILISVRLRRDGSWGMAKPCPQCQDVIAKAGLKAVYYSDGQGNVQKL